MIDFLFGDPQVSAAILGILVLISYATGAAAAYIENRLTKERLIHIAIQKTFIFMMLIASRMADHLLQHLRVETFSLINISVWTFYSVNEIKQIIINNKRVGIPIPRSFENIVEAVAYKEKQEERGECEMFKLYLDAGHGGKDSGAAANGILEKDIALAIAKQIREILSAEYENVAIEMSRSNDTFLTLQQRTDRANSWGADFFLSIHINAGGGTGFESFIYPNVGSLTKEYQKKIHGAIIDRIALADRGMKEQNFHVLRETSMPALLTENGFIDRSSDATKMKSHDWIAAVARGHVEGLEAAFNLKKVVRQAEPEKNVTSSLQKAIDKGIIQGYPDGSLGEDEPVTLNRLMIILDRLGILDR